MEVVYGPTFEEAFKQAAYLALVRPNFVSDTRIGVAHEILDLGITVKDPETYVFKNTNINRISYDYAEDFWKFMISGGTDAEQAFEKYPNVSKFLAKPKSSELPENFNTFYGPRIASQLPKILDELERSPTTRRACILILDADDADLLDKDETLEYPCTVSYSFQLRNKTLFMHTVMRSQNLATVFQLDIYLQGKLLHLVKEELLMRNLPIEETRWSCYIQNAHVFERDFEYVESFMHG